MDQTLKYLRETLSNYTDNHSLGKELYEKVVQQPFLSEGDFVRELSEVEIHFLNEILPDEIEYAMENQDMKRVHELNEVYELLIE
ncbi:hypothetical protein J2S13_000346 [Oikeobacillus pervagus]|uniref:Sporulation protein n=1 Tax=Oikeobacillus pervagus TaxID=1325931 RepID=A0AAJ1T296_9BACI|nr:sigma-G-dependent sporulation-specific acid-soluble spore protein CsgA [Oikeobacillus pervagus]MDQ0213951.1 hypothetical protein [Oikeobacillus pervagus]